jgi:hypothetical protein
LKGKYNHTKGYTFKYKVIWTSNVTAVVM